MKRSLRVACIQNKAGSDWKKNLRNLDQPIRRAIQKRTDLIVLPENFFWRGPQHEMVFIAKDVGPHVIRHFQNIAEQSGVAFLLGSMLEPSERQGFCYNTSVLISGKGRILTRYRKIHLFDIRMKEKVVAAESECIRPGRRIVSSKLWGVGLGLTICYDLRFPELYRRLTDRGCRVIFVPAHFAWATGKAHWEILLRARAIENQVFIIAPDQVGIHPASGIRSFGTSLIIDPWGTVLKRGSRNREEVLIAELNLKEQSRLRQSFPVLKHRRFLG